jgi:hypothetical protein
MPILVADDSVIENPSFGIKYVPFSSVDGCMAAWRGDFSSDLTGNGNTLTKIGNPNQAAFGVSCSKNNGYLTSVSDGINRTLICIHRQPAAVDSGSSYNYPFGNLSQNNTVTGVGIGIIQSASKTSDINSMSGVVGAGQKTDPYFSLAKPATTPAAKALSWQWTALVVDGSGNFCALYVPSQSGALVMGNNTPGVNLANRVILEGSAPSRYRIGAWRDPSTPTVTSSNIEIASCSVFDKALLLSDLNMMYLYDKIFMAQHGEVI